MGYLSEHPEIDKIEKLIGDYGVDRIIEAPYGHRREDYVGVYPGGWVDFLSSYIVNSVGLLDYYNGEDNLTGTSLDVVSACFFSNLHKLGYPDNEPLYTPQTDKWRSDKLGESYKYNPIYSDIDPEYINFNILNKYSIKLNDNELESIYYSKDLISSSNSMRMIRGTYNSDLPFIMSVSYLRTILQLKNNNNGD